MFLKNAVKQDILLIVGCGRLGASLANASSSRNGNVLVIDRDKDAFRKLSPSFGGLTMEGDAADLDTLEQAHIRNVKVVLCATDNDNTNIMVAQIAKTVFHVDRVLARLYDSDRMRICAEYGIETICPSILSVREFDRLMSLDERKTAE